MAQTVVIDIEARFIDHTSGVGAASRKLDQYSKTIERAQSAISKLNSKKVNPQVDVNDNAFLRKIGQAKARAEALGKKRTVMALDAVDRATRKIMEIWAKAKAFARSRFMGTIGMGIRSAVEAMSRVRSTLQSLVGRAWHITISVLDRATAPLRNLLGQLKTIAGMAGLAGIGGTVYSAIAQEVTQQNLEAQYATMFSNNRKELGLSKADYGKLSKRQRMDLGYEKANERVQSLIEFAGQTPFTRQEIFQADKILQTYTNGKLNNATDRKLVGNLAAIGGTGYQNMATVMGRMYVNMAGGHGIGDSLMSLREMGVLSADAEKNITALADKVKTGGTSMDEAWKGVRKEFSAYDGMMEEMSNKLGNLLLGVKAFVTNNVLGKIGKGVNEALTPFLSSFREWRNGAGADWIKNFGQGIQDVSQKISTKLLGGISKVAHAWNFAFNNKNFQDSSFLEKLSIFSENLGFQMYTKDMSKIAKFAQDGLRAFSKLFDFLDRRSKAFKQAWDEVFNTDKYKNLSTIEKIGEVFNKSFIKPFDKWWKSGGQEFFAGKTSAFAEKLGKIGSDFAKGFLGALNGEEGQTGVLSVAETFGRSFVEGFKKGFDISGVLDELWGTVKEHPLMSTVIGGTIFHKVLFGGGIGLPTGGTGSSGGSGGGAGVGGVGGAVLDGVDAVNGAFDLWDNTFGETGKTRRQRRRERRAARREAREHGNPTRQTRNLEEIARNGGKGRGLGRLLRGGGKALGIAGVALGGAYLMHELFGGGSGGEAGAKAGGFWNTHKMGAVGDFLGGLGGGAAGATIGGGIGAMFGGVGAIPGALIGGAIGGIGGGAFGKALMGGGGNVGNWKGHGVSGQKRVPTHKGGKIQQEMELEPKIKTNGKKFSASVSKATKTAEKGAKRKPTKAENTVDLQTKVKASKKKLTSLFTKATKAASKAAGKKKNKATNTLNLNTKVKAKTSKTTSKVNKEMSKVSSKIKEHPTKATHNVEVTTKAKVKTSGVADKVKEQAKNSIDKKTTNATAKATAKVNTKAVKGSLSKGFNMQSWVAGSLPKSVNATVRVNVHKVKGSVSGYSPSSNGQRRGGIIGAGVPHYAEGGFVRGGAQLAMLAEEGTPEAVIPLGKHRRQRGMQIWQKAGEYLGVKKFAAGGIAGGSSGGKSHGGGGGKANINVGGITINVTGGNAGDAISDNKQQIAQDVAEILNDAFTAAFENQPASA